MAAAITAAADARSLAGGPDAKQVQPPAPAADVADRIRLKAMELDKKAVDLQLERERSKQLEAVLAIKERVVALEAQRRRDAAFELQQLKQKRETLEARIEYARRAVLQSFDVYDRGLISNPPPTSTRKRNGKQIEGLFERSKRRREQMLYRLLELRGQSGGLIASGDALNFFVELCGSSAFAHDFYRTANKGRADPNDTFLNQLVNQSLLQPADLAQIRYQRGLTGPKLSGRLNQPPLDVNWPPILKRSLSKRTDDIERRREQVLGELKVNAGVSPQTADGLLDAVRDLLTAMHEQEESLMQEIRKNGTNVRAQSDWLRYHSAEEHVRLLLAGAYRLIEARTLADVSLPPLNDKGPATVEQLLTYMHQNNLRFSPADANGQTAYNRIFELMSRYYIDLRQYKLDMAQDEQRVEGLRAEEAQVKEVMLGNRLDNLQQSEIEIARYKAMASMSTLLLGAIRANAGEAP